MQEFDDRQTGLRAVYSKVVDCRQIAASIREIHGEFNDCIIENRSHLDWLRNVKVIFQAFFELHGHIK